MRVRLKNDCDYIKEAKMGFSWTIFFFSAFVPLFRQDWKWSGIMWAAWFAGVLVPQISDLYWIFTIVMAFLYNKIYIQGLMAQGYQPASEVDETLMRNKGYLV